MRSQPCWTSPSGPRKPPTTRTTPTATARTDSPKSRKGDGADEEKSYALYAAADLIERVGALQSALPAGMLDDWLEHLDRMFRGSFPDALVATWREHRIDVFSHLRQPEFRPPEFSLKQRVRYFEALDGAARSWGVR